MSRLGPSLRRTRVRERPLLRAGVALGLSFLLNALGLLLLARSRVFDLGAPGHPKPVALAPIPADQWEANRAVREEAASDGVRDREASPLPSDADEPSKPPEPEPAERVRGQVVDVAPPPDSTPPKDARFLAERDGSVERETRSRHGRADFERVLPAPSDGSEVAPPRSGAGGESDRELPGTEGPPEAKPSPASKESRGTRVALAPGPGGELVAGAAPRVEEASPAPSAGEGGRRGAGEPGKTSIITPGTLARVAGGPFPDHLPGVEEGEATLLNTRHFKYATYFNQMKRAVAIAWDPMSPYDARDPTRTIFGTGLRETWLHVTLDETGKLKYVDVAESSGLAFLDEAAADAFRIAQPFPNPPRGLVEAGGEIRFYFGFSVPIRSPRAPGVQVYMGGRPLIGQ